MVPREGVHEPFKFPSVYQTNLPVGCVRVRGCMRSARALCECVRVCVCVCARACVPNTPSNRAYTKILNKRAYTCDCNARHKFTPPLPYTPPPSHALRLGSSSYRQPPLLSHQATPALAGIAAPVKERASGSKSEIELCVCVCVRARTHARVCVRVCACVVVCVCVCLD